MKKLDLKNRTIKIAVTTTFNSLPYSIVKIDPITHEQIPSGVETRIMETLSNHFNFTIKWIPTPNRSGKIVANKTWNGMVGMILRKEVEIATGAISLTPERMTAVDFLFPHHIDQNTFALSTSISNEYDYDMQILFYPFHEYVWLALIMSLIAFFILNYLCMKPIILKFLDRNINDYTHIKPKIDHNLLWINFCLLSRQSYCWLSNGQFVLSSIKIKCTLIWAFSSFVMTDFYTGHLSSLLTVPIYNEIDTIDEFAQACDSGLLKPLGLIDNNVMDVISKSEMSTLKTVWEHIKLISNRGEGMRMIADQLMLPKSKQIHYAIISPRERLKFLQMTNDIIRIPPRTLDSSIYTFHVAMPISKSFAYQIEFDQIIKTLWDSGIMKHWKLLEILITKEEKRKQMNAKAMNFEIGSIEKINGYHKAADEEDNEDDELEHHRHTITNIHTFRLKQLKIVFITYLLFNLISFVVFSIEVVYYLAVIRIHSKNLMEYRTR